MKSEISIVNIRDNCETKNKCWLWKGSVHRGNPCMKIKSKRLFLRRVVYWLTHGELAPKNRVYAICGEDLCLNPEHLTTNLPTATTFVKEIKESLDENTKAG